MPGVWAHWVSSHWALLCFVSGVLEKLHLSRNSHTDFASYLFPWTIKAASASLQSVVCNTHCVRVFSRCASLVCFEFMCGIGARVSDMQYAVLIIWEHVGYLGWVALSCFGASIPIPSTCSIATIMIHSTSIIHGNRQGSNSSSGKVKGLLII